MAVKRVSPEEALDLMRGQGYAYLDVRSVPEFAQGHPAGAYNVPLIHMGPGGQPAERPLPRGGRAALREGRRTRRRLPDVGPLPAGRVDSRAGGLQQPADPAGGLRRARRRWSPAGGRAGCPRAEAAEAGRSWDELSGDGRVSAPRAAIVTGGTGALGRAVVKRLLGSAERAWRCPTGAPTSGDRSRPRPAPARPSSASRPTSPTRLRLPRFVDEAQQRLGLVDAVALVAGGWAGGTTLRRGACRRVEPHAARQSRSGGLRVPRGASPSPQAGRQHRGHRLARRRDRRQRHGGLRRLQAGAARARPRAGAGEPRARAFA